MFLANSSPISCCWWNEWNVPPFLFSQATIATITTQPRLQVFSVNDSVICNFAAQLTSSVQYSKILSNLVDSSWSWSIMCVILANQGQRYILNEYKISGYTKFNYYNISLVPSIYITHHSCPYTPYPWGSYNKIPGFNKGYLHTIVESFLCRHKKLSSVVIEQQQPGTQSKSFTHMFTHDRAGVVGQDGFGALNSSPPVGSSLQYSLITWYSHCTKVWKKTYLICYACIHFEFTQRRNHITEITPKSLFLCEHYRPYLVWFSCWCKSAIRYSVNIAKSSLRVHSIGKSGFRFWNSHEFQNAKNIWRNPSSSWISILLEISKSGFLGFFLYIFLGIQKGIFKTVLVNICLFFYLL